MVREEEVKLVRLKMLYRDGLPVPGFSGRG